MSVDLIPSKSFYIDDLRGSVILERPQHVSRREVREYQLSTDFSVSCTFVGFTSSYFPPVNDYGSETSPLMLLLHQLSMIVHKTENTALDRNGRALLCSSRTHLDLTMKYEGTAQSASQVLLGSQTDLQIVFRLARFILVDPA